jgi:hypothetical protein
MYTVVLIWYTYRYTLECRKYTYKLTMDTMLYIRTYNVNVMIHFGLITYRLCWKRYTVLPRVDRVQSPVHYFYATPHLKTWVAAVVGTPCGIRTHTDRIKSPVCYTLH